MKSIAEKLALLSCLICLRSDVVVMAEIIAASWIRRQDSRKGRPVAVPLLQVPRHVVAIAQVQEEFWRKFVQVGVISILHKLTIVS